MQNGRLNGTRRTTSRLPSRSVAIISWAPQSENQRRSWRQRGDSPIARPVSNVLISGMEECVVDTYQNLQFSISYLFAHNGGVSSSEVMPAPLLIKRHPLRNV